MRETKWLLDFKPQAEEHRKTEYGVLPLFLNRWSPRSFAEKPVSENDLNALFEAASWAPSASNEQPWRFIAAKTPEDRETFLTFISPFNVEWCDKAPVLVLIASITTNGKGDALPSHAFDAGSAWTSLALEAVSRGLTAHAMGGFDQAKARETLGVPNDYALHAVVAIGYQGDASSLSERNRLREVPNGRLPLSELVHTGSFRK